MIRLLDGPAQGAYLAKRAPLYLRAVKDKHTGKKDVLDQLDDNPTEFEECSVYKAVTEPSVVHLNFGSAKRGSGFYMSADYRWLQDVTGENLRVLEDWRAWCMKQPDVANHNVDWQTGVFTAERKV